MLHKFPLYCEVMLVADLPAQHLKKGDIGTIVELAQGEKGEPGYVLEFFDVLGRTVLVTAVEESKVGALSENFIAHARSMEEVG